jgi:hypothetical protein
MQAYWLDVFGAPCTKATMTDDNISSFVHQIHQRFGSASQLKAVQAFFKHERETLGLADPTNATFPKYRIAIKGIQKSPEYNKLPKVVPILTKGEDRQIVHGLIALISADGDSHDALRKLALYIAVVDGMARHSTLMHTPSSRATVVYPGEHTSGRKPQEVTTRLFCLNPTKHKTDQTNSGDFHKHYGCICGPGVSNTKHVPCTKPGCDFKILRDYKNLIPDPDSNIRFLRNLTSSKNPQLSRQPMGKDSMVKILKGLGHTVHKELAGRSGRPSGISMALNAGIDSMSVASVSGHKNVVVMQDRYNQPDGNKSCESSLTISSARFAPLYMMPNQPYNSSGPPQYNQWQPPPGLGLPRKASRGNQHALAPGDELQEDGRYGNLGRMINGEDNVQLASMIPKLHQQAAQLQPPLGLVLPAPRTSSSGPSQYNQLQPPLGRGLPHTSSSGPSQYNKWQPPLDLVLPAPRTSSSGPSQHKQPSQGQGLPSTSNASEFGHSTFTNCNFYNAPVPPGNHHALASSDPKQAAEHDPLLHQQGYIGEAACDALGLFGFKNPPKGPFVKGKGYGKDKGQMQCGAEDYYTYSNHHKYPGPPKGKGFVGWRGDGSSVFKSQDDIDAATRARQQDIEASIGIDAATRQQELEDSIDDDYLFMSQTSPPPSPLPNERA